MPDTQTIYPSQSPIWATLNGVDPNFVSSDDALHYINLATQGALSKHPEAVNDLRTWLHFARGVGGGISRDHMAHVANALVTPGGMDLLRTDNAKNRRAYPDGLPKPPEPPGAGSALSDFVSPAPSIGPSFGLTPPSGQLAILSANQISDGIKQRQALFGPKVTRQATTSHPASRPQQQPPTHTPLQPARQPDILAQSGLRQPQNVAQALVSTVTGQPGGTPVPQTFQERQRQQALQQAHALGIDVNPDAPRTDLDRHTPGTLPYAMAQVRALGPSSQDQQTILSWLQNRQADGLPLDETAVAKARRAASDPIFAGHLRNDNLDNPRTFANLPPDQRPVRPVVAQLVHDAHANDPYNLPPPVNPQQPAGNLGALNYQDRRVQALAHSDLPQSARQVIHDYLYYTGGTVNNIPGWAANKAAYAARTMDPKALQDLTSTVAAFRAAERNGYWDAARPDVFASLNFNEQDLLNALSSSAKTVPFYDSGVATGGQMPVAQALEKIRQLGYRPEFLQWFTKRGGAGGPTIGPATARGEQYEQGGPTRFKTTRQDVGSADLRALVAQDLDPSHIPLEALNFREVMSRLASAPAGGLSEAISHVIGAGQDALTRAYAGQDALKDPAYQEQLRQWREGSSNVATASLMAAAGMNPSAALALLGPHVAGIGADVLGLRSVDEAANLVHDAWDKNVDQIAFWRQNLTTSDRVVRAFNALLFTVAAVHGQGMAQEGAIARQLQRDLGVSSEESEALLGAAKAYINDGNQASGRVKGMFRDLVAVFDKRHLRKTATTATEDYVQGNLGPQVQTGGQVRSNVNAGPLDPSRSILVIIPLVPFVGEKVIQATTTGGRPLLI